MGWYREPFSRQVVGLLSLVVWVTWNKNNKNNIAARNMFCE